MFFFFEVLCYVWHDVNMRINIDIMHDEWTLKNRNENICKNKITEACKVLVIQVDRAYCVYFGGPAVTQNALVK